METEFEEKGICKVNFVFGIVLDKLLLSWFYILDIVPGINYRRSV